VSCVTSVAAVSLMGVGGYFGVVQMASDQSALVVVAVVEFAVDLLFSLCAYLLVYRFGLLFGDLF